MSTAAATFRLAGGLDRAPALRRRSGRGLRVEVDTSPAGFFGNVAYTARVVGPRFKRRLVPCLVPRRVRHHRPARSFELGVVILADALRPTSASTRSHSPPSRLRCSVSPPTCRVCSAGRSPGWVWRAPGDRHAGAFERRSDWCSQPGGGALLDGRRGAAHAGLVVNDERRLTLAGAPRPGRTSPRRPVTPRPPRADWPFGEGGPSACPRTAPRSW